ncbi:translation elongation factor 4 [Companilactobacillus kimchiensis]|uniref:Elongation factor 4 n=1 Tax=Companilactobacillus kimchiensis TaxID=993692 RepID=A0A0R2LHA9_9LACO|nr:translation elongation factor 4 [Companilactobacillus kimchiensis]KRN98682.1 GTP-binding translation elongation factor LepA [Companilactobacillus kimchiensis]
MKQTNIRNFSIIAHIDHGKSTLADRIMEQTDTIDKRDEQDQLLDDMSVEKQHGVTVKSRTVRNIYHADNGQDYEFNFIDTPGHVDFSYEVSKSLAATDGVLLLVDATQGVQAQTVANFRLAQENELQVLPIINKIDSPNAQVEQTEEQIRQLAPELKEADILYISAKTGLGVHEVLEAITKELPAPQGDEKLPLKALIFDSLYDSFKGVIAYIRVMDGKINTTKKLKLMAESEAMTTAEIGILTPNQLPVKEMKAGDVGYVVTGIKDPEKVRIGDTITDFDNPTSQALPGYKPAKSMVFAGIYPVGEYKELKDAIYKLKLNDSSLQITPEVSDALGAGFRGGFLGIFHLQIIKERLHDEFGVDVLTTAPNVPYRIHLKKDDQVIEVNNPVQVPEFKEIDYIEEPMFEVKIDTPNDSISDVMKIADRFKGEFINMDNGSDFVKLTYKMPLSEIAYNFFNQLKSVSHGYASMTSEFIDYEMADVVKAEILINYTHVDALTFVAHRQDVQALSQKLVEKLKYTIPRRLNPMPAQIMVEGKVVARVDIPPLRKNAAVNGKKYSASKKQALLRSQKNNKKNAARNEIQLPQKVFNSILELDD